MNRDAGRNPLAAIKYLLLAAGVLTGLVTLDNTPVAAQNTGCYWVVCYQYLNYVCRNRQPKCNDCYNINGTYCGGPC